MSDGMGYVYTVLGGLALMACTSMFTGQITGSVIEEECQDYHGEHDYVCHDIRNVDIARERPDLLHTWGEQKLRDRIAGEVWCRISICTIHHWKKQGLVDPRDQRARFQQMNPCCTYIADDRYKGEQHKYGFAEKMY